jgi:hypothetical protein
MGLRPLARQKATGAAGCALARPSPDTPAMATSALLFNKWAHDTSSFPRVSPRGRATRVRRVERRPLSGAAYLARRAPTPSINRQRLGRASERACPLIGVAAGKNLHSILLQRRSRASPCSAPSHCTIRRSSTRPICGYAATCTGIASPARRVDRHRVQFNADARTSATRAWTSPFVDASRLVASRCARLAGRGERSVSCFALSNASLPRYRPRLAGVMGTSGIGVRVDDTCVTRASRARV